LLGVAEAGFFPGAILFLSMWVPADERSKIFSLFYLAQPLTTVLGAPLAALLLAGHGTLGLAGWRFMYMGVAIPAIVVGIVAWFYLCDRPADAKWLSSGEKAWLISTLKREGGSRSIQKHGNILSVLTNRWVWTLAMIYFGFIYGLYSLAFFLPTIIHGFEAQDGVKFDVLQQGMVTAIPYLPAAVVLYFWSRDATVRGVRRWHIWIPAVIGGISIPLALFMGSPTRTVMVITVTACAIFAALPNFWTIPPRFLSGAAAAAGIALINTAGNFAGFAAGYITGVLKDWTGSYVVSMFLVGAMMLLSGVLMIAMREEVQTEKGFSRSVKSV
jgi:MFS family permease